MDNMQGISRGRSIRAALRFSLKDFAVMLSLLLGAALMGALFQFIIGRSANVATFFFLAVLLISRLTDGYLMGILASFISIAIINTIFSYPFLEMNFTLDGYPLTFLGMLVISIVTCALTTQLKQQLTRARMREKQARLLDEQNRAMVKQQEAIRTEAEKEKLRGNLLRAISHDLRTPLTAIYGASTAILTNPDISKEEQVKLLEGISEDALWLTRMVENVLSITRIREGQADIHKELDVVEEVVAEAAAKVRQRYPGQLIQVHVPDEVLLVPMDSMMIKQVIINLLENAIRHSGVVDRIDLTVRCGADGARFEVRDRGRGIRPEDLSHLFKIFTKDGEPVSDSSRGMGIGLSVCKSIIEAHGGDMRAENAVDGGAVFRFTLPL